MKTTGHLFVVFDALNIVKGIKTIGGSENQTYYIESKKFVPDRRITPLIWQPYIYVTDPNGIIPFGDKVKELAASAWYIGSIEPSNRVTAKEDTATIDTPFAVDSNNALHVRKNTDKPIQVFFEAEYLDTRKDKVVHISLSEVISGTSNSEEKPAPSLSLSKPQSWKYSPFENVEKEEVEAVLSQDGQLLSGAVEWCKVEGDVETPLSEKDAFYLGGQNTDKLVVNPSLMSSTLLRARNLSEETYNKYYGINPEWDNRMQEVMENRNLVSTNSLIINAVVGNKSAGDGVTDLLMSDARRSLVIPIVEGKTYSISYKSLSSRKRFSFGFYKQYKNEEVGEVGWFDWSDNTKSKFEGYIAPPDSNYLIIYFGWSMEDFPAELKVEQNEITTPYTPAPEDLHYRNLCRNSGLNYLKKGITYSEGILQYEGKNTHYKTKGTMCYLGAFNDAFTILKDSIVTFSIMLCKKNDNTIDLLNQFNMGGKYMRNPVWSNRQVGKDWSRHTVTFTINEDVNVTGIHLYTNDIKDNTLYYTEWMLSVSQIAPKYITAPEDLAPSGIIKGSYQSDIKFTRYLPKLDTSIEFLTGDTLRAGMTSVKMKAVVKTNKELISNPSKYFDIKWYLEPTSAGAKEEFLGSGEVIEVPVSKIDVKGGRFIPFRFDLKEKLL